MSDILTGAPAANFIAGQWSPRRSASVYERRSPWGASKTLGESPSSRDDVAAAVAAAVPASRPWSRRDV